MVDDARCIVTLYLSAAEDEGITDGRTLRDIAFALLARCPAETRRGGMVTSFGMSSHKAIELIIGSS